MTTPAGTTRPASFRGSMTQLRTGQKSNVNAAAYSRWVNRPAGRVLAAAAHQAGLTPNHVTATSAVFTFTGIACLALLPLGVLTGVVVALLLALGYALDSADGQLARLRGGGRPSGEWLDHVVDATKIAVLHLAVLSLWFRELVQPELLPLATVLIPLGFSAVASVSFFGMILTDLLQRRYGSKVDPGLQGEQHAPALGSLLALPGDYGLLCVAFVLLAWWPAFVVAYSLLGLAALGMLAIQLVRWYRRMEALS
ncbi:CDP-alcohol phosphatidyltransferase family protein [Auraticoccus monumenti]|uniref:CDP-alcohol phosphatidyltransferase n=1 Tax=Auraticoccus monumenti TaxID=675864 RepID=A0A1G6VWJ8_9ACTN|nr:CDP-alcohol phosphatidyltransferase family protein [Auraticoccus monumenti]SDD57185.1 CDP-alcohol phosphatidyltransferase [Auraticoccus monumenti]